jgi:hypothetical protein
MRKTAAPAVIDRGDTPQEARVIVTLTTVTARVPPAVGAMTKRTASSANAHSFLTGRL